MQVLGFCSFKLCYNGWLGYSKKLINCLALALDMAVESAAMNTGLIGVGAGLALGLAAIGTGLGQREAMAAAIGAISEDPQIFAKALLFAVLPETVLIFGFVTAFLILGLAG